MCVCDREAAKREEDEEEEEKRDTELKTRTPHKDVGNYISLHYTNYTNNYNNNYYHNYNYNLHYTTLRYADYIALHYN